MTNLERLFLLLNGQQSSQFEFSGFKDLISTIEVILTSSTELNSYLHVRANPTEEPHTEGLENLKNLSEEMRVLYEENNLSTVIYAMFEGFSHFKDGNRTYKEKDRIEFELLRRKVVIAIPKKSSGKGIIFFADRNGIFTPPIEKNNFVILKTEA